MYGLPKNIDLTFLIGIELQNVCIGFNDLIFQMDDSITMAITSECRYQYRTGAIVEIDSYPKEATVICKLIGSKIVDVKGHESGELILKFSNGDTFTVYDDSEQYESYLIKHPPNPDIVV